MGGESQTNIYKIIIKRKTAKIIILLFFLINLVMFLSGFFLGKGSSLKSEIKDGNKNIKGSESVVYNPVDTNSALKTVEDNNKPVEIKNLPAQTPAVSTLDSKKDENNNIIKNESDKKEQTTANDLKNDKKKKQQDKRKNNNKKTEKNKSDENNDSVEKENFTLEVYVYDNKLSAESFRDILSKRGYPAFIDSETSKGKTLYRVRLGKFKSRRDAVNEGKKLVSKGIIPKYFVKTKKSY